MATNKNPDAIKDLLGTTPTPKPVKAVAPAKATPPKKGNLKQFSVAVTEENIERLKRHRYWKPGIPKVQDVVNAALKLYFDSKPEFDKPIPDEE